MTKKTLSKILAFGVAVIAITAIVVVAIFYSYGNRIGGGIHSNTLTDENFVEILIYIFIAIIAVIAMSVMISVAITKSILKPIDELGKNLDNIDNVKVYDELKPLVDALKQEKEKQKALDRQKKQFTANVSHELKTPLTSIAGYAELIEAGIAKEPDIKPFAATIRKQALRLVTLSEDIIQLSQLDENDEQGIVFASVDIYETARDCIEALSINAKAKGINITLDGESTFIRANPSLLEELIYNLCDNAIRYNKENEIGRAHV